MRRRRSNLSTRLWVDFGSKGRLHATALRPSAGEAPCRHGPPTNCRRALSLTTVERSLLSSRSGLRDGLWAQQRHQRLPFATPWQQPSTLLLMKSGTSFSSVACSREKARSFAFPGSLPHDPRRWKISHVSVWLRQNELNALVEPFRENCIDGQV